MELQLASNYHRYDTDTLMIFGGIHGEYGPNPNYVWWADGSYMYVNRFPEPMNLVRGYHKTLAIGTVERFLKFLKEISIKSIFKR